MTHLTGMTWNHPRGIAPLEAVSLQFQKMHPGISISWEARSLKDFEDYPVELLAEKYDMVMIDHPFIGTAVQKEIFIPLDEWLPQDFLKDQAANSVGGSYASYTWQGHQWALALDAASQVAAYRADLLTACGLALPKSWQEVVELVANLPAPLKLGLPLNATHTYSSFLSLCANSGGPNFWNDEAGIDPATGEAVLYLLQTLLPLVHPVSLSSDPIQMFEMMSQENEIAYVPLIFGYSNYARPGFRPEIISFSNIPSTNNEPGGALLGGVGLAISARSSNREVALNFAAYAASGICQKGLFFESGGQPGYRAAWTDPEVNRKAIGFFSKTLQTLDLSYTRPRFPGYHAFQEKAGQLLHQFLLAGAAGRPEEIIRSLNRLYGEIKSASAVKG